MTINPKISLRTFAIANELTLPPDPAEITIPYGQWPFGFREVELDGKRRKLYITQRLDRDGATAIANEINANPKGIPIYFGHPDAPELAAKYPDKRAKAWITRAEATTTGLRLSGIAWNESPAGGFGWYSPYWTGEVTLTDPHNARLTVNTIMSVGLVNNPNILDFRLANEAGYDGGSAADINHPKTKEIQMEQIIAALGLPPEATLEQILAEITKVKTAAQDAATQAEAANAEAEEAKKDKEDAATALANEKQLRIDLLLDGAIADRRISPIARPAWAKRLLDNIETGQTALANEKPPKTAAQSAGLDNGPRRDTPLALANELAKAEGIPFDTAWARLKTTRPDLFTTTAK